MSYSYGRKHETSLHDFGWVPQRKDLVTGLHYFNPDRRNLAEVGHLVNTPLAQLLDAQLQPSAEAWAELIVEY